MPNLTGFYTQVLKRAGIPVTPQALANLGAWQRAEGGWSNNAATFNPFNTTRGSQYQSMNSVGVRAYPNFNTGVQQTVDTLKLPYYKQILSTLGGPTAQFAQSVYSSPWGTKHGIGGITPGQVAQVAGVAPAIPSPVAPAPAPVTPPPVDNRRQQMLAQVFASNNAIIGIDTPPAVTAMIEQRAQQFGGTTVPPVTPKGTPPQAKSPLINRVLQIAKAQIGKPYIWGAESPKEGGFDCSGLLDYAFRQAGVQLPGGRLTTWSAMNIGRSVKGQSIRPGDWLIVNHGKHIVMAVGGGKVIAAPHAGEVVQYQPLQRFLNQIVDVRRVV